MPAFQLFRILETLNKHRVDFIVVGNLSAVLHGAPVTTFDLDIVHSYTWHPFHNELTKVVNDVAEF